MGQAINPAASCVSILDTEAASKYFPISGVVLNERKATETTCCHTETKSKQTSVRANNRDTKCSLRSCFISIPFIIKLG